MWKNLDLEWKILLLACALLIAIAWPVQIVLVSRQNAALTQSVDPALEPVLRSSLSNTNGLFADSVLASIERNRQWKAMIPLVVKEQQQAVFAFSVVLFLVLSFFALWTLRRMTRPLRRLATAVSHIGRGERIVLQQVSGGALGLLEKSVAQMQEELDQLREQARIQGMEKAWQDIAGVMAHEIKNPLTPIRLTLDRLEEKALAGENVAQDDLIKGISRINSQIDVLERLVNQFRSFSRSPDVNCRPVGVEKILQDTATDMMPRLSTTIFGSSMVIADPYLLGQVILNLYKNSLEAGATVMKVSILAHAQVVDIVLCDNGPGICKEDLLRVWLPYVTMKKGGTGLGLPVVKKLVETMGGVVTLHSKTGQADHGVTAIITLPGADKKPD